MPDGQNSQTSRRRQVLKAGGLGLATFALSGCQGDSPNQNPGGSSDGTPAAKGGTVSTDKFKGDTIKLGLLPTNSTTAIGTGMINGMDLAVKEINSQGGILGANVEYLSKPTKVSAAQARKGYFSLTRNENVDATFGSFFTLRSLMRPIAQQKTLHLTTASPDSFSSRLVSTQVSPVGGNPQQEYEKYKYQFRYGPPNVQQVVNSMIEHVKLRANDYGWDSVAVLIANVSMVDQAPKQARGRLSNVVDIPISKQVPEGTSDWTPIFDEVEQAGCDAVLTGWILAGPTPVQQWSSQRRPFDMGGVAVKAQAKNFWEQTGGDAEGFWTHLVMTGSSDNTSKTEQFRQSYRKNYGTLPAYTGPVTYDAVHLYADAVRATGSRDPEDLIPYLENMTWNNGVIMDNFRFLGPDNKFAHDPKIPCVSSKNCGQQATQYPAAAQWQKAQNGGGAQKVVWPEGLATSNFQKPPWQR